MTTTKKNKTLNIILWIVQGITAALMIMSGFMKLTTPIVELSAQMKWTGEVPEAMVRTLGALDLLGGIGIVLPGVLRIKPGLVTLAASGVSLLMISAMGFHLLRGESSVIGFNILILLLVVFVAWGRYAKLPIERAV